MSQSNQASMNSFSSAKRPQVVPYFPPPPNTQTLEEERKKKPSRKGKPPLPIMKPKQRQNSKRHTIGPSTQSRKKRLEEVHLPEIKLSPRHWLLVSLLLLSFFILILGFIFANCVALPHTSKNDYVSSQDAIANTVTLYVRQSTPNNAPTYPMPSNIPAGPSASTTTPAAAASSNATTTPDQYLADENRRLGFDSPKNLAILFFYTATLPLLTIFHTLAELVLLCCSKRRPTQVDEESKCRTSSDGENSITDLKPTSTSTSPPRGRLHTLMPFLPAISLTISTLLTLGWITTTTVQLHCELHPLSPSESVCPIQLHNHKMPGITELSIAKNVLGWVLVAVYIGYVGWCARVSGLVWRAGRDERREKKWVEEMEKQRTRHLRLQVGVAGKTEVVDVKEIR